MGASLGQLTDLIKVHWLDSGPGPFHGYPITEAELITELRKRNPAELERFQGGTP